MASTNPTFADANEATGVEPLNTAPTAPQPPKQHATGAEPPASLTSLPSGFEPVVFPLDLGSRTKNSQSVASLPSANQFEDLVKAKIRPPGPARAEELGDAEVSALEAEYADVWDKVKGVVEGGQVKAYKVEGGVGKREHYIVGLDRDGDRIVGVRAAGSI